MTYAFVQDTAASWEHYQRFVAGLSDPMPQGLIVHLAGPTDEGFRVIAVWDSEHDFKRFQAEQLEPVIAALGGRSSPVLTFRELHPAHVVLGAIRPAPESKEEHHVHP
jgi:hypothetical protein